MNSSLCYLVNNVVLPLHVVHPTVGNAEALFHIRQPRAREVSRTLAAVDVLQHRRHLVAAHLRRHRADV